MIFPVNKPACPYCQMMRRAVKNAFIGMSLSAFALGIAAFAYQNLQGI